MLRKAAAREAERRLLLPADAQRIVTLASAVELLPAAAETAAGAAMAARLCQ